MTRVLVYSFATLMDVVLSAALQVCMWWMSDAGAKPSAVAAFVPIWAIVYLVCSLAAGHLVTPRNASWLLIAACTAAAAVSAVFIRVDSAAAIYALTAVLGVASAFFFTPFQVFMKLVDRGQNKGICHSTGTYTFSWSLGYAIGPFVAGFLWTHGGWHVCHIFNAVLSMAMAMGVYCLKHHADVHPTVPQSRPGDPGLATREIDYSSMPDLAWMAWVFGGAGCLVMALIRSLFPSTGVACGIPKPTQGTTLLILSGTQALIGLIHSRSRTWMYRPLPVLAFGLFGVAGLALFTTAQTPLGFHFAAALFGVYSGSFYFYFVFHSLVHPTRAGRYVSINEAVVGVASLAGPFFGGYLADHRGPPSSYLAALGLTAATVAVQSLFHWRRQDALNGKQPPRDARGRPTA
jgi:MFS family permease